MMKLQKPIGTAGKGRNYAALDSRTRQNIAPRIGSVFDHFYPFTPLAQK
jgi:hypothetical protein